MSQVITDIPALPLRDIVVYPHMAATLLVGREKSVEALEAAMSSGKQLLLVTQKQSGNDDPNADDLYSIGTVATILRLLKLPEGPVKLLVEGERRVEINQVYENTEGTYLQAEVTEIEEPVIEKAQQELLMERLWERFNDYADSEKKEISEETISSMKSIEDLSRLLDTMISHSSLDVTKKQQVLEIINPVERVEYFLVAMDMEAELQRIDQRIRGRVKSQMEKSQREYYLNEQMKAIQKELGNLDDEGVDEMAEMKSRIESSGMPNEAKTKVLSEWRKLSMMSPMSSEAAVLRNYMDWALKVPWKKRTKARIDIEKAKEVLDADHYGLDDVKERILEYLAVQKRVKNNKGSVLCLVGPPGVGKTSLARSVAKATGRKFVRMALGGMRDEAEIRGHRRTYIGALPGKIIQKMTKAEVKNPLFLLDEIDKMGMDHRGDPASALLEVLDPEQNHEFNDHYLEMDYSLSDVMFICTSNSMNIPAPLLDRMEVIRLSGYTEQEKFEIAKRHLLPRQIKQNGIKEGDCDIQDEVLLSIVRHYTREAGVRSLEREIAKLCRKVVYSLVNEEAKQPKSKLKSKAKSKTARGSKKATVVVKANDLETYLGPPRFQIGLVDEENQVGLVTGLAWTSVGGELLNIEAALVPGRGRFTCTGSLGDVMQESIKAAITAVKSRSQELGIAADFFEKNDLHIHLPEGATPKDGPSAGIGLATVIVSALTQIAVKSSVAMTGEINLRGQVMKIGGLKEKLLAAHRGGVKTVIIPQDNKPDLQTIPQKVLDVIDVRAVKSFDEVLEIALERKPKPLSDKAYAMSVEALIAQKTVNISEKGAKTH